MSLDLSYKDLNRASTERIKKLAEPQHISDRLFVGGRHETCRYI